MVRCQLQTFIEKNFNIISLLKIIQKDPNLIIFITGIFEAYKKINK